MAIIDPTALGEDQLAMLQALQRRAQQQVDPFGTGSFNRGIRSDKALAKQFPGESRVPRTSGGQRFASLTGERVVMPIQPPRFDLDAAGVTGQQETLQDLINRSILMRQQNQAVISGGQ